MPTPITLAEAFALPSAPGKRAIIVGGGVAGLAAARKLKTKGIDAVILEGRQRVGGRVFTTRLGADGGTSAFPILSRARASHAPARGGTPVDIGASMMHAFENADQWVARHARDANIRAPMCVGRQLYEPTHAAKWFHAGRRVPMYTIQWLHEFAQKVQLCAAAAALHARENALDWDVEECVDDAVDRVEKANKLRLTDESLQILRKILGRAQAYCCPLRELNLDSLQEWNRGKTKAYPPKDYQLRLRKDTDIEKDAEHNEAMIQMEPQPITALEEAQHKFRHDRLVLDGYSPFLIDRLAKDLKVCFDAIVNEIRVFESDPKVIVNVSADEGRGDGRRREHQLQADYVIVTVPLGVLKKKSQISSIKFEPPLSDAKRNAIQKFGMGTHNKVVLLFNEEDVFWEEKVAQFNCPDHRFQFMNLHALGHKGLLVAHVFNANEYATGYHGLTDDAVVDDVMKVLRDMFQKPEAEQSEEGDDSSSEDDSENLQTANEMVVTSQPVNKMVEEEEVLDGSEFHPRTGRGFSRIEPKTSPKPKERKPGYPIDYVVTRWDSDPFAFGSYSFWKEGSDWEPAELGRTEHERILFAGEHTDPDGWQCVDGAYKSGIRAAHDLLVDCEAIPPEAPLEDIPPMSVRPKVEEEVTTKKRRRKGGGSKNGRSKRARTNGSGSDD